MSQEQTADVPGPGEPAAGGALTCQSPARQAPRWYVLDAQDGLIAVDPAWDEFALANDGALASSSNVLGRPLREFLVDDATLMFVEALLQATRLTGRPRTVSYRCDGPGLMRRYLMTATPLEGGQVRVDHELQCSEPRPAATRYRYAPTAAWWRCSQCLALREPGMPWIPADLLPPHLLAIGDREVRYGVCGDCLCQSGGSSARAS